MVVNSKCGRCGGYGASDWMFLAIDECPNCKGTGRSPFELDLCRRARLLIIGHGRHGKDSVGEILRDRHGMRSASSSEFAAQKAVFPLVSDLYPDWRAACADRHAHRDLWFHAIRAYNLRPGPSLAEQLLEHHDIYIGMRSRAELEGSRDLFDLVVWVDASDRLPPEPGGSMELGTGDADLTVDNNGPATALPGEVAKLAREIESRLSLADACARHN